MNDNNMDKKVIRVAIYCRVSTTEQAEEGYSIGEQERLLIEYCDKHGYEVYKTYADKGISGKDIKHRPAMQSMLEDATQKKFDMVISWKINRISRKLADAIKIVDLLETYGITYLSYSEPFETNTPAGKMQFQMMALIGEKGVAAISAILYLQFIFVAIFFGFASGIAPVISYNYGAQNHKNIRKLFVISIKIVAAFSVVMFVVAEALNRTLGLIFASQDPVLLELMVYGFRIIAISVLFSGTSIFASGFFTALNNGKISALISMLRTFVLEAGALLIMPELMGIDGVWWALPFAETTAAVIAIFMMLRYRKVYGY